MVTDSESQTIDLRDLNRLACTSCGSDKIRPAALLARIGISPSREGHQIGYDHTVIVVCDSCGAGFVEVRKHDCFDFEEVWDQDSWFPFDPASGKALLSTLTRCPDPLSENCVCEIHRALRVRPFTEGEWKSKNADGSSSFDVQIILKDGLPRFVKPDRNGSKDVFDLRQPARLFRQTNPDERERRFDMRLEREGGIVSIMNWLTSVLLLATIGSAPFWFGWWSVLVSPCVLVVVLFCYLTGDHAELGASVTALGAAVVFAVGTKAFVASAAPWIMLLLLTSTFGWTSSFLALRFVRKLQSISTHSGAIS